MRDLKFRAWDGEKILGPVNVEDMMFSYGANYDHMPWSGRSDNRHTKAILMQFTGLTDMYLVDIYEGDLLFSSYGIPPKKIMAEVFFVNGCFGIRTKDGDPSETTLIKFLDNLPESDIRGNIYENPELLEATQ